jgi:hypothetical protein
LKAVKRGKDFGLQSLVRGEGGTLWPSRAERRLLRFALETFGGSLSRFLLSGLGEEEEGRAWLFTVTYTDRENVPRRRELRIQADDLPEEVTILPRQREPLVILALLWLLLERTPFSPRIFYHRTEVLEVLGWKDIPANRQAVDEAVERYRNLSYTWTVFGKGTAEIGRARGRGWARFISGYGYRGEEDAETGERRRLSNRVDFAAEFISELTSRSLFGVNWDEVSEIERTSFP